VINTSIPYHVSAVRGEGRCSFCGPEPMLKLLKKINS
jgi:hypothetical protein